MHQANFHPFHLKKTSPADLLVVLLLITGSFSALSQDTLSKDKFEALKNATEAVFEAKKDSFNYHKDYVTQEVDRDVKIYSMVWIGKLFNPYDNHALIAYSINDSMIHVEIRHQIGKVWVRRFHNTSIVSKAWKKLPEPVIMLKGEQGEEVLFITSTAGLSAYMGVNGDKWVYSKGNFKKQ
ncbi:MAG: hypothetical protein ACHQRM_08430 [Bacteroidia bacterium]